MPRLLILFVSAFFLVPAISQANPVSLYECHGCTPVAMQQTATTVMNQNLTAPRIDVTVYNLAIGSVRTWRGTRQFPVPREPGVQYPLHVTEITTSAAVVSAFNELHDEYVANGGSLIFDGVAPFGIMADRDLVGRSSTGQCTAYSDLYENNAWAFGASSQVRNDYIDHVEAQWRSRLLMLWTGTIRLLKNPVLQAFDMPLVDQPMAGGGSAAFNFNWNTRRFEYISGTLRDCNNQTVPETEDEVEEEYEFPSAAGGERLARLLRRIYGQNEVVFFDLTTNPGPAGCGITSVTIGGGTVVRLTCFN